MQRLFSAFPGGWPGGGLLLLRSVVGVTAVVYGGVRMTTVTVHTLTAMAIDSMVIASGAALLVGFLTPATGIVLGISIALSSWLAPAAGASLDKIAAMLTVAAAAAVALIGPGAFSVDALLFGRREIVISSASHLPKS